jgi:hypothetical protein
VKRAFHGSPMVQVGAIGIRRGGGGGKKKKKKKKKEKK